MGKLYDLKLKTLKIMDDKKMDKFKVGGQIGLSCGFLWSFINQSSEDDPVKIAALQKAMKEILGEN